MENLSDIKIAGSGVVAGGEYHQIRISGSGKILDDITAEEIRIAGAVKALGVLKAKLIKVAGAGSFEKDVKADEIKIAGSADIDGNVEGELIKFSGVVTCKGDINGEDIEIDSPNSRFQNIYGENVFVGETNIRKRLFHKVLLNKIESIEATNIEINHCIVKKVSGKNVYIGSNCDVDLVEYQESLEVDKKAKVKETIKI